MVEKIVKVLLVEDNAGDARLIREMLAEVPTSPFDLEWVDRLSTGLERLAAGGINVILLDLGLPDSEGLDTLSRTYAQAPGVPIVVLTGLADEALAVKALQKGAQEYLAKEDVNSAMLARVLRYSIERHRLLADLERRSQELQSSEAHIRKIIEKNADGIVVVDRNGIVRLVNPAAEALFGRQVEDLLGESFGFPVVASDWVELDVFRRDGDTAVVEMRVVETEWEGERAYLASLHDITGRKRAEEALVHERDLLQALMDNIPDTIYFKDTASRFTRINRAQAQVLGIKDPEEAIGKTDFDFFTEEHAQDAYADEQEFVKSGQPLIDKAERIRKADGQFRWVSATKVPIMDEKGQVTGIVGVSRDITQRKRAEEALRETRDYLDNLIRHANAPIIVWDPQGRITRFNHAFEHLTGHTADEVIGQELHFLFPETSRDESLNKIARTLSGEYWESVEIPILRKDGEVRLALWSSANTYAEDGTTLLATIAQGTDITERKQAEEVVRRHLERIEALREIDRAIISTLDLTGVLDIILAELERVIPYHSASIFLFSSGIARLAAGRGFPDMERVLQVSFPVREDPLTYELLQKNCSLVLADAQADERFLARGGTEYVRSWIGVPLMAKEKVVGFLAIDHREPGFYDEESAEMAQDFAGQVAIAIENARLFQSEQRRAEQLAIINELGRALAATLDLSTIYRIAYKYVKRLVDCPNFAISLFNPEQQMLTMAFCLSDGEELDLAQFPPLSHEPQARTGRSKAIASAQPVIVSDLPRAFRESDQAYVIGNGLEPLSALYAPIIVEGRVIGLLEVQSYQVQAYRQEDVELLSPLANQIGLAIQNARLYQEAQRELAERKRAQEELRQSFERLRRSLEGTVNVLVSAIEMRDPYTAGHQRRVTQLACVIAREMGLPEEQIEGIRMAGLIHDVGKISVPTEILSKPGQLNELEWGLIQAHPQVGYDVLKTIDFPWPLAQIVLQHHERLDGSGYPQGLSAEEIVLEARILAVADVVEAMASHRPYRPTLGIAKALEEISQNRGILYDPEVVDVCLKLFTEKGFKLE